MLAEIADAHVLDVFCGPVGEMHREVWKDAKGYAGIDKEWRREDTRERYVADSLLTLRNIDLARFNVFDVDAFGSPWEALIVIAARREWRLGERGAIVITDGSGLKTRTGGASIGMTSLLELRQGVGLATTVRAGLAVQDMCLTAWIHRANVKPLRRFQAEGRGSGKGGTIMQYRAVVFEGYGTTGNRT